MLLQKERKVRKCCVRWSQYIKQLLIDEKVNEQQQELERKYYQNG
ncbi:hypothetical protein [Alteribacter populi]|nr:hypothetical protein [Alteribacter populi]